MLEIYYERDFHQYKVSNDLSSTGEKYFLLNLTLVFSVCHIPITYVMFLPILRKYVVRNCSSEKVAMQPSVFEAALCDCVEFAADV